jgi:tyrosinase
VALERHRRIAPPSTAPGGTLAVSPCVSAPGPQPRVRDMLDFQGNVSPLSQLGFAYDDVRAY